MWLSRYLMNRRLEKEFINNSWMFSEILDRHALLKWVINNSPEGSILSITALSQKVYTELRRFTVQKQSVWEWLGGYTISVEVNSISRPHIAHIVEGIYFGEDLNIFVSVEGSDFAAFFESYDGMHPDCTYLSGTVSADQVRQLTDDRVVLYPTKKPSAINSAQ